MHLEDLTLTCRDCGDPFVFTTGEQGLLRSRGRHEAPRRCPPCDRRVRHPVEPEQELSPAPGG